MNTNLDQYWLNLTYQPNSSCKTDLSLMAHMMAEISLKGLQSHVTFILWFLWLLM